MSDKAWFEKDKVPVAGFEAAECPHGRLAKIVDETYQCSECGLQFDTIELLDQE